MDHEYDDDRPTDRAGEVDHGDQAPFGANASEYAFDAPDLATAFLAALDEADDRLFAPAPLDDLIVPPAQPPIENQFDSQFDSPIEHQLEAQLEPIDPSPVYETPETMAIHLSPAEAAALQAGSFELTPEEPDAEPEPTVYAADAVGAAEPAVESAYVVDHDPAPADDSPSARAVAEAFAREQAALELWGSDEASALLDSAASEAVTHPLPEPVDAIDSIEAIAAQHPEAVAEGVEDESPAELIAETVSNADSYYDPDTLRLTRPLFSPDEPRAFAAPVYVGDASEAVAEGVDADAESDPEVLEDLEEFVAFSLGDTRCVVPIRNVIEIGRIPQAVAVPNAPAWLHGLGNLRGQVLSLIDLRAFLGIGRVRPASGRMLVLRADDDEVQAGLLVDHVHQIVSLSASRFHKVPETLARHYARHAWGVCDYGNFTMIGLEVDSLLGVENMIPLGEGAEVM
jgi:purine-binding chemotaxis protein CheW